MSDENTAPADDTAGEQTEQGEAEQTEQENGKESSLAKALHAERQTIKELKAQLHELRQQQDKIKLESLSEAERAVEEAKRAGYEEAMQAVKADLTRSKVTAAAAAAGFADPGDASGFLDVSSLDGDDDIVKAVADLAKNKPYLLKRTAQSLEQGQQSKSKADSPNDWLRSALGAR
jgi:Arc/MetJ family transcription regulator